MSFETLSKAIVESKFQDFLNTYSFNEVYRHFDKNDGRHKQYTIGFESNICKMILFYESGGSIGLSIGTANHDFSILDSATTSWVDIEQLLAYIQKKPWMLHFSKHITLIDVFKEYLNNVVNDFRIHKETIFSMFSSQEVFENWHPQLREYIKSDLNRRYGT
jgi:hypothetical protein